VEERCCEDKKTERGYLQVEDDDGELVEWEAWMVGVMRLQ
jgi:hypothetical protein